MLVLLLLMLVLVLLLYKLHKAPGEVATNVRALMPPAELASVLHAVSDTTSV
jgi:hypothetical protein